MDTSPTAGSTPARALAGARSLLLRGLLAAAALALAAPAAATELLANGGFESGATAWAQSSQGGYPIITTENDWAHTGSWYAWLAGYDGAVDTLTQDVAIPADALGASVRFWYWIATKEAPDAAFDNLEVSLRNPLTGATLATLATFSNLDATADWVQSPAYNLIAYKGQTVRLVFRATTDSSVNTNFFVDDVALSAIPGTAAPTLAAANSVKTHGGAGSFSLPLSLNAAAPTTEPRAGAGSHTIVFSFDKAVTAGTASILAGTATAGTPSFSGANMTVPLTGVANAQYVTVAVSGVVAADGGAGGSGSVRVGFLEGDTNGNRNVTIADLLVINSSLSQTLSSSNFLRDVNVSGTISIADLLYVNSRLTQSLPAP